MHYHHFHINPSMEIARSRVISLRPLEYRWVTNILKTIKSNPQIKKSIINGKLDSSTKHILEKCPRIDLDDHTDHTLWWSVSMAKIVLKTKSKPRKNNQGAYYRPPWLE
jgi:hypothetical protein